MSRKFHFSAFGLLFLCLCVSAQDIKENTDRNSQAIINMISAVNQKDAQAYVTDFSEDVQIYLEAELKVNGKSDLQKNRAKHFEQHPEVRSEIQHLVEIDNKVVLHDKVWLDGKNHPQDIVEIFSFENHKVVRVDVIQPKNLFRRTKN